MVTRTLWAGAVLIGALTAAEPALAQGAALDAALRACRVIADTGARAACYDRIVDGLAVPAAAASPPGALPPAVAVPPSPPPAAPLAVTPQAPRPAPPPAARFGADDLPREKREPGVPPPPDQIVAKAVAVRTDAQGFVVVTLDNGQTWRQTDGPGLRILPGAEVKIRSGLMGSYLMSLASGNRSVRARRVN
jgi:hypothetical protein